MCFSQDGSLFAWCNPESVHIVDTSTHQSLHVIDNPKVSQIKFSSQGNILATWTPYTVDQNTKAGRPNLFLWDVKTGEQAKAFIQKKQMNWCPQWSKDDTICGRNVNNELQFYEDNKFDAIKNKLHLQKVSEYSIALCPKPYMVAAYVPGSKGQPSYVRVYRYPNFGGQTAAIANKSFFKAERVALCWNKA
ncbi:eukaryotic translation initiation factor 2A-like, partial [Gigantopelta aegis]|uniref:eukaryotic translation initiation factor 2A-like n=1 Tax=Gigantopelta aegis TaxID=1735272 RepID=UPI001B88A74D